jgi:AcrR family transcriptional regulator
VVGCAHDEPPAPRPAAPGRPRDAAIDARVLEATLEILRREGYARLTIDHVAAEAGVARPTVYRRWPSKAHLLLDAVASALGGLRPGVSTGHAEHDLTAGVTTLSRAFEGVLGETLPALVAELSTSPELASAFVDVVLAPRRASMAQVLRDGIERGEVRPDIDVEVVLDLLAGPLYYRAIFRHAKPSRAAARAIVETVWRSIARPPEGAR